MILVPFDKILPPSSYRVKCSNKPENDDRSSVLCLPKTAQSMLGDRCASSAAYADMRLVSDGFEDHELSCKSLAHMVSWMDMWLAAIGTFINSLSLGDFQNLWHLLKLSGAW